MLFKFLMSVPLPLRKEGHWREKVSGGFDMQTVIAGCA